MSPEFLAVIGSLNLLIISAVAYFFRGLVEGTNDIKLKLGILITKHANTEKTTEKNSVEIEKLKAQLVQNNLKILHLTSIIEEYSKE